MMSFDVAKNGTRQNIPPAGLKKVSAANDRNGWTYGKQPMKRR
jgi:hypothetical protein